MKNLQSFRSLTAAAFILATMNTSMAGAANDAEFSAGIKAYGAKDFKGASEHFGQSVKNGNKSPEVWLYSGHCFAGMGHYQRALQTYEVVVQSFRGTKEAKAASDAIAAIRKKLGMAPAVAAAAPGSATTSSAAADTGLMSRIVVIPPQFGHKPVLPTTIAAARDGVAALPAPLRKRLDESDARIKIGRASCRERV